MKCNACKVHPRYRQIVTIEEPAGTADATGHIDLTAEANWARVGKFQANFVTKGGREGRIFDQVQAEVSHVLRMRSTRQSRAIHPEMRLKHEGRTYNIVAAYDVDNDKEVVQLELVEVV